MDHPVYIFKNYLGNTKEVNMHLLRYEIIHETRPVNENPMNMPKMKKKGCKKL